MAKSENAQGWYHAKTHRSSDRYAAFDLHVRHSGRLDRQTGRGRIIQAQGLQRREDHLRIHRLPGRRRHLPNQHARLPNRPRRFRPPAQLGGNHASGRGGRQEQ